MPPRPVNRAPPAAVQAAIDPSEEILLPPTDVNTTESTGQASLLPALSPAHINDGVINYYTSDGMKLYNVSIAPPPIKEFEGNGGNTQTWINDLDFHPLQYADFQAEENKVKRYFWEFVTRNLRKLRV